MTKTVGDFWRVLSYISVFFGVLSFFYTGSSTVCVSKGIHIRRDGSCNDTDQDCLKFYTSEETRHQERPGNRQGGQQGDESVSSKN